jgi:dynein heavy chain
MSILQVEVWLNRLLDRMRSTILNEMNDSVSGYEEKPHDQWLFDYPAQVALCGPQIWWSTEVNIAFRLEEGYENALKDYFKKQVCLRNNQTILVCRFYLSYISFYDQFVF